MLNAIKSIDPGSPLQGKVMPGDRVLEINSNKINDVLDYKFHSYEPKLKLLLQRPNGSEYTVNLRKAEGQDPGLNFESYLMDRPRACANGCVFCFIDQLPRGMRKTMYFKDDDARLSFLLGNYITLTNLSDREVERIIALRISPVNVSVHTTNPRLRCEMMRNPKAGESLEIMRRFADAGIKMNCQIVCCPGINDGAELDRTMRELFDLHPAVNSVSVVPLGLTKHREGLYPLKPYTKELACATINQVEAFADKCLAECGSRVFFCGDELYLTAEKELPPDEYYEDHTQLDNGVGMLRLLETEFLSALKLSEKPDGTPFTIATGTAAAPMLKKLVEKAKEKYPSLQGEVIAVENEFFGTSVTVAGLLTGGDLLKALKGRMKGERLFIPQNMLRREEADFLDDVTLKEFSFRLGVPVYPVEQDGFALWDAISGECLPDIPEGVRGEDTEYNRYNRNG